MKYINSDLWRGETIASTSDSLFVFFQYNDFSGPYAMWNEVLKMPHDISTIEQYKLRFYVTESP